MSFQFSETYVTPIAAGAAAEPWASHDPHPFRTLSLDMEEHPRDWRGYFMASVLVMEAIKGTE